MFIHQIKNTQGVKSLLLNNNPKAVRDLVKRLDVDKAEYLKLVFQAQQDAGKGAIEANYYRHNIKYGGLILGAVYLFFFFGACALERWSPGLWNSIHASLMNRWVSKALIGGAAMGVFNYFDWVKMFGLDHFYRQKWEEQLQEEVEEMDPETDPEDDAKG